MQRTDSLEKTLMLGKIEGGRRRGQQEEKGTTEDEMVGWHHRLDGHEFEKARQQVPVKEEIVKRKFLYQQ